MAMLRLKAACERRVLSAARVKLPLSARAMKWRNWAMVVLMRKIERNDLNYALDEHFVTGIACSPLSRPPNPRKR